MLNTYEIVIILIAMGAIVALCRRITSSVATIALLCSSLLPAVFLAVEGSTQFLTVDENYMILELEDPASMNYRSWNLGGYRISILITGTLVSALKGVFLSDTYAAVELHSFAKSIHWLVGFVVLLLIYESVRRFFISKTHEKIFFVGFFNVSLLLSTTILALKIINYDVLSMLLGMLCLVLAVAALHERRLFLAFLSVVAGALGSQEKLIASPMFALALFSGTFIASTYTKNTQSRKKGKDTKSETKTEVQPQVRERLSWGDAAIAWSLLNLTAVLVCVFSWGIVNSLHKGLRFSFRAAIDPLVAFVSPLLNRIPELLPQSLGASKSSLIEPIAILTLIGVFGIIASLIAVRMHRMQRSSRSTVLLTSTVGIALALTGLASYYATTQTVYAYPTVSVPPGTYIPKAFNGVAYHYMQTSEWKHKVSTLISAYSSIGLQLPTTFWIAFFATLVFAAVKRRIGTFPSHWSLIALLALLFPLLYTVTQTPASSRYLNLFTYMVGLSGLMLCIPIFADLSTRVRMISTTFIVVGAILELSLYRPVIGSFRPFWSTVDVSYNREPQPGVIKSGWNGWGEEIFLAGERIAREFRKPGETIHVYSGYFGAWLTTDTSVKVHLGNERRRAVSDKDFYVINRAHYEISYPFPFGIKPLFTIDYNGRTMAWIFRGDQLKDRIMFSVPENQGGFVAELPEYTSVANDPVNMQRSTLRLFEDGVALGPAHAAFDTIRKVGKGHYNHWQNVLFFSASDNTDPRLNGRVYSIGFEK